MQEVEGGRRRLHEVITECRRLKETVVPLSPDEVIGGTDEGSRGFAQMHSAHCWGPPLCMPHCSTAAWQ